MEWQKRVKDPRKLLIISMFVLAIAGSANLTLRHMRLSEDTRDFAIGALYGVYFGLMALYIIAMRRAKNA